MANWSHFSDSPANSHPWGGAEVAREGETDVVRLFRAELYLGDKVGTEFGRTPFCPLAWDTVFCDSQRIGTCVCQAQVIEIH